MTRWFLLSLCLVGMLGGCSLVLDWNSDNLRCGTGPNPCDPGYSCLAGEVCVADYSLQPNAICYDSKQCEAPYICPPQLFRCVKPCSQFYAQDASCASGQYCALYGAEGATASGTAPVGGCADSANCVPGTETCSVANSVGNICIGVNSSVQACVPECTLSFVNNSYSDNCGSDYCTPVGSLGEQGLTCVPTSTNHGVGAACNATSNPCAGSNSGLGCINGFCRTWCPTNNPVASTALCGSGVQCIAITLSNPNSPIGVCCTAGDACP